jgi:hypothetical protein
MGHVTKWWTGFAASCQFVWQTAFMKDHILDDCLFEEGYDVGMRGVRAQLAHARNKRRLGNGVGAERRTAAGLAARKYARSWAQRRLQAREKRGQG